MGACILTEGHHQTMLCILYKSPAHCVSNVYSKHAIDCSLGIAHLNRAWDDQCSQLLSAAIHSWRACWNMIWILIYFFKIQSNSTYDALALVSASSQEMHINQTHPQWSITQDSRLLLCARPGHALWLCKKVRKPYWIRCRRPIS